MEKNTMAKTRKVNDPYEIWIAPGWEWRVLKKWQADDHKPYARWFCAVVVPGTFGSYDMGDCYAAKIMQHATKSDMSTILPWREF